MEIITFMNTLMMKAKILGDAKKSEDKERIKKAQLDHDEYKELCLKSDKMITNI